MATTVPPQMNFPHSLLSRLSNLLQTSQWSDCTFIVGCDTKQEFRVHRILLAACSPVFEAMCFGPLAEKGAISIPDMEPQAFNTLLQYIYTDNVQFASVEEACDVLYAAKKYLISNLSQKCHLFVKQNMQAKDVVTVYEYAKVLGEDSLYEPCLLMLRKYALEVLNDPVHHLSSASVTELLSSESINGCESCLIEAALSWAKHECDERSLQTSVSNQRYVLEECGVWHQLRFLTLSRKQFSRICRIKELLSVDEIAFMKDFLLLKMVDEKRQTQHVSKCSGSLCPLGVVEDDEMSAENDKRLHVVMYRDKWKRRRLNMVLARAETDENVASKLVESQTVNNQQDVNPSIPMSMPSSISGILRSRLEVGYRLSLCRRPLLKQSATMSGPLELQVAMQVSAPIDLRAVQVYSRLYPSSALLQRRYIYPERLEVKIFDDAANLLMDCTFTEEVQYNTEIMVHFRKFVRLSQDRTYKVVVKLRNDMAEYPFSFLGQFARSQEIDFQFSDSAAKTGSEFVNRLDMGFICGFAYS